MLYSEFVEGTGCKENDHNYLIYKRLELMYMADDSITKQEIYEYGKKLVDNSKTEAELELEAKVKAEIAEKRKEIKELQETLNMYKTYLKIETDKAYRKIWKERAEDYKKYIAQLKSYIHFSQMMLS